MTLDEFKTKVRENRGKLSKHDEDLEVIFEKGEQCLIDFTLEKKLMGIQNIRWVAERSPVYQKQFCRWMAGKNWKAEKNEIQLWIDNNIDFKKKG